MKFETIEEDEIDFDVEAYIEELMRDEGSGQSENVSTAGFENKAKTQEAKIEEAIENLERYEPMNQEQKRRAAKRLQTAYRFPLASYDIAFALDRLNVIEDAGTPDLDCTLRHPTASVDGGGCSTTAIKKAISSITSVTAYTFNKDMENAYYKVIKEQHPLELFPILCGEDITVPPFQTREVRTEACIVVEEQQDKDIKHRYRIYLEKRLGGTERYISYKHMA